MVTQVLPASGRQPRFHRLRRARRACRRSGPDPGAPSPRAELVEDLERRLVARQAKLSPKLHGRHAGCLAGHQIGRPKPYAQRRVRARHDRSHRQSGVTAALAAAQDARTICEAERLSRRLTMGANKPVAPASLLQVGGAGRVVGKKSLELGSDCGNRRLPRW